MTRTTLPLLTLLALLGLPLLTAAQAPVVPSSPTFRTTTSYESCTETWAFACGMRDENGRTYGTAHPIRHCSRYQLQPNGEVRLTTMGGLENSRGRYRIEGSNVHIEWLDAEGRVRNRQTLRLSADGASLGEMQRIDPAR